MAEVFYAGSEHIAHIRVTNPTEWDWEYDMNLKTNGTSVSRQNVTVPAGEYRAILDIAIQMPSSPATLAVTVSILEASTGADLGNYPLGTINVVAEPVPEVVVTVDWD